MSPAGAIPPRTTGTRRGGLVGRWLASEWGLRLLALVLAILVWAVVWNDIQETRRLTVRVKAVPRSPDRFVAFTDGQADIVLRGPQGELERARTALGSDPLITVPVGDIEGDTGIVRREDREAFHFGFARRIVEQVSPEEIRIFRWEELAVRVLEPAVEGVPRGVGYEIEMVPDVIRLRVPATTVDRTIRPDPIDVGALFEGAGTPPIPPPADRALVFDAWRSHEEYGRFRTVVDLPAVTARITFFATDERMIRNRIEFRIRDGFAAEVSGADPIVSQGYYEGHFVGRTRDLDALEADKTAWWFVVRVPEAQLPSDEASRTATLRVEFLHVASLDELDVAFQPSPEDANLLLEIVRSP